MEMQRNASSDLQRLAAAIQRSASQGSWTGSDSPTHSPPHTAGSGGGGGTSGHPLVKTDSTEDPASFVSFTVGEGCYGDEEGEDSDGRGLSKRDIHTLNEQRRRDVIKTGYSQLMDLVPTCHPSPTGVKLSRAAMLQKAIDYIIFLQNQQSRQSEQLQRLEREVKGLRIMKENYEHIARAHQHAASATSHSELPDHIKFMVFQGVADQLFQSFAASLSLTSFETASSCMISWLEEYCKPQALRPCVMGNLRRVQQSESTKQQQQPPPH